MKQPPTQVPRHGISEGFDSSGFLVLRGGIPRSMGSFQEIQSQRFLLCGFLVCWLTVAENWPWPTVNFEVSRSQTFALWKLFSLGVGVIRAATSKGIGRQGIGSFRKELLWFNTMPCCPMPLLVHFWGSLLGSDMWKACEWGTRRFMGWVPEWLYGVAWHAYLPYSTLSANSVK